MFCSLTVTVGPLAYQHPPPRAPTTIDLTPFPNGVDHVKIPEAWHKTNVFGFASRLFLFDCNCLTEFPIPLGNNNDNPIMSTYLGPRMKLICFYLRLVRGGGGPPIPLKHNYDHNNHQVSPLLTHTCLGTDKLKHNRSIHFLDAIGGNKYNFSTWFFLTNELPQPWDTFSDGKNGFRLTYTNI